jgi:hypothetical protein
MRLDLRPARFPILLLPMLLGACGGGGGLDPEPMDPPPQGWQIVDGVPQQPASEVLLREPQTLLVAAGRSLHRSADGLRWTALPELPDGVEASSLIATGNAYWAGSYAERGVFVLPAEDTRWRLRSDGLSGAGSRTVLGFAMRGTQLYAATAGAGLFRRSLDSDGAWVADREGLPSNLSWNVDSVVHHQGRLIAGAGGNGALYIQLADAGPWREVTYDTFTGEVLQLWSFLDRDTVLLAGGNRRLYRSVDGGETWRATLSFPRVAGRVRFATADDVSIYAMATAGAETLLLRSSDEGLSWETALDALRGIQGYDIAILGDQLYLAHQGGLWRTPLN